MKIKEITEGKVKNAAIVGEYDKLYSPTTYCILINGKVWKKDGKPVSFNNHSSASRAADKITATRNITTQVILLK